jgi:hypothetical protein
VADRILSEIGFYETSEHGPDARLKNVGRLFGLRYKRELTFGVRIAEKLRQLAFRTGDTDRVTIAFCSAIPPGQIETTPERNPRFVRVLYGAAPSEVNELDPEPRERFVIDCVLATLRHLFGGRRENSELLVQLEQDLAAQGTHLEIECKTKETERYRATVSFLIEPDQKKSCGVLRVTDKETGASYRKTFVKLAAYTDIFPLTGTITIARGAVKIKPRSSARSAGLTTQYKTPMEVGIEAMPREQ